MNSKIIAVTTLSLILLIGASILFQSNKSLKSELSKEKSAKESVEFEKSQLLKMITLLKADIKENLGKNEELNKVLSNTEQKLSQKESELLRFKNVSADLLKRKTRELQSIIDDLNSQVSGLKLEKTNLSSTLSERIKQLEDQNSKLIQDIYVLRQTNANNFRVEAVRGKSDRLMVRARRTQRLVVYFDIPKSETNNISFSVTTPSKKEFFSGQTDAMEIKNISNSSDDPVQRMELTFKPKEKLEKGIFLFNIKNNDHFLSSTEIRLK